MPEIVRAHIYVSGDVQGVFFRQETCNRARTRNVSGWVSNRPDGRVEAVFEGSSEAVESMILWCREGPRMATVSDVEVEWEKPTGQTGFRVR